MKKLWVWNDRPVTVLVPDNPNQNWVWRAEFLGAFDYADQALLKKGWHIIYYRLSDMFGAPCAVKRMKEFHDYIVAELGLKPQCALFGFSRGGLYSINYTVEYPEDVGVLYLDAPVVDITTWPKRYSPYDWELCKAYYDITDDALGSDIKENPLNKLEHLQVPVIMVAGTADELVPYEENGAYVEAALKEKKDFEVILKPGVGHHPHSLEEPTPIIHFIERYLS